MTTRPDAIDRLSPAVRYQIANGLGWSSLRPVQALATEAILDGANCVVLAPTAGGKTEAAFLPLLSKMDVEDWRGVSVLYVAPIRALLNNQEARLSTLTGLIGRRAGKWHGDVKAPARRRMIDEPPDVLAITPESLEAMLLSTRTPARRFLAHLRAVVIDEVHAFAGDDRGAHLVALLERGTRIAENDIQRIGLSATVGDPEVIVQWLSGSSQRPQRVVDPGGPRKPPELALDFVGTLDNAVLLIDRLYPGTRRLVFVDSRRRVEELGHRLSQQGVDVYLSHSSLALSQRTAAEKAFEEGTNCVIVATSALELGIDVGDLDHVIQIDAPSSVSSFLQRMGRTGRRAGSNANCTFLATDDDSLLRAAAIIELFRSGYIEPAAPSSWAPHVLAHQAIALAMQEQGSAAHAWWNWLEGCAAFREVSAPERESIVRHMVDNDILVEADARLALGARGEKLYGAKNFLELYAVFSTPRVLRVMHGQSEVGVVDALFLQDKEQKVPNFVLAGRPWRIVGVDWRAGTCSVEPAEAGGYPRWFGQPVSLARSLCQSMRRVLAGSETDPSWSKRAIAALEAQREAHAFLHDAPLPLQEDADGRTRWWTFAGGAGNRVLAGLLELELGERVSPSNTFITFSNGAAESAVAIRQAIDALAARTLTWEDAARLVDSNQRSRVSKFQPCLPPEIEHGLIARETMSVEDASKVLTDWSFVEPRLTSVQSSTDGEGSEPPSAEIPSPSALAEELHMLPREEALAFVDSLFGAPEEWRSPLIRYRLASDFQADWKEEVGNWLKMAERLGFLDPLLERLIKRTKRGTRSTGVDPNDRRHNELVAELAPAMVAYYLVGTGWSFKRWEPITGGDADVDLELEAPGGQLAHVQVKAPDQPGVVANHRREDGENDQRVLTAVLNAAEQLPRTGSAVNLIAVCANRTWPVSGDPGFLVTELIGSTVQRESVVSLPRSRVGRFYGADWAHVAGVVMLDYLRGIDVFKYPCTVLLNPMAIRPASADWFPRARVCQFDGGAFRWIRGEPGDEHTLPDGTQLDEGA